MSMIKGRRFLGNRRVSVSAIAGAITMSRTSGQVPCFVQASASAVTATGISRAYEDLEFRWDFGDAAGVETFTLPTTGEMRNANIQYGPEAGYVYRTPGSYTITLRARGLTSGGAFIDQTFTQVITVSAFNATGGEYWFDAVAGSDSNSGLSPSAPKQSLTALSALIASNTAFHLKRGGTFAGAITVPETVISGARFDAYGVGADPVVQSTGNGAFYMDNGSPSLAKNKADFVVSGISFQNTAGNTAVAVASTSNTTGTIADVYFDRCTISSTAGGGLMVVKMAHDNQLTQRFGFWGCSITCTATANLGSKHCVFGGPFEWWLFHGNYLSGGGSSVVLDHHMYMEVRNHAVYSWNIFGPGPGRNYCLNLNAHHLDDEGAGPTWDITSNWHNVRENVLSGTLRGVDSSHTNTTEAGVRFGTVVNEGNVMRDLTGDGIMLFYSCEKMTLRRNMVYRCEGGRWFAPDNENAPMLSAYIYENMIYVSSAGAVVGRLIDYRADYTFQQQITDNTIVDMRADARTIRVDFTGSVGEMINYNTIYSPNDTLMMSNAGTKVSWSAWQAAGFDVNGANVNPNWIDPANGVFDIATGKTKFGIS